MLHFLEVIHVTEQDKGEFSFKDYFMRPGA